MAVPVSALFHIQDPSAYKLHTARLNYENIQPLDLFLQDKENGGTGIAGATSNERILTAAIYFP